MRLAVLYENVLQDVHTTKRMVTPDPWPHGWHRQCPIARYLLSLPATSHMLIGLLMNLGDDPVLIAVRMQWSTSAIATTNGLEGTIVHCAVLQLHRRMWYACKHMAGSMQYHLFRHNDTWERRYFQHCEAVQLLPGSLGIDAEIDSTCWSALRGYE